MKKNMIARLFSIILSVCLCASVLPIEVAASGVTYYVSPNGANTDGLSEANAFKTLAAAVNVMESGDTCIILPGVYREELSIYNKDNLTFRAKEAGTVIITAADVVDGWTKDTMTNVWKAEVGSGIYNGDGNIVFQDGVLRHEARWPDVTEADPDGAHALLNRDNYARVDQGGTVDNVIIQDADLAELSHLDLTGAFTWCVGGHAYWSQVAEIIAHDTATNTITTPHVYVASQYLPRGDADATMKNLYYIMGHKGLLSSEGEWYKEEPVKNSSGVVTTPGMLYMYHEGASAPANVELRAREYTVRIDKSQNVVLEGIHVRGGLFALGKDTENCTIKNVKMETIDYRMPRTLFDQATNVHRPCARGAIINGTNNLVAGCEIFNLYGEGILLSGNDNRVLNNYIHDFNFEATYADAVQFIQDLSIEHDLRDWDTIKAAGRVEGYTLQAGVYGNRQLLSHNTIIHGGRSAIGGEFRRSVISYNDIADGDRLTRDGGSIYLAYADFEGSEFHHNVVRDSTNSEGLQYGFYFDSLTSGLVVYKNLLYNLEHDENTFSRTINVGYGSLSNLFLNNTIVNKRPIGGPTGDRAHTVFINNLFQNTLGPETEWLGLDTRNNGENYSRWNNSASNDYSLRVSNAVDTGEIIPGVTDGYVGEAPDLGAFEYGQAKWMAGHEVGNATYEAEIWAISDTIPYKNLLANSGFEYGTFDKTAQTAVFNNWSSDSTLSYYSMSAWNDKGKYTKNGEMMLKLASGQSATQTVRGLKPNTAYEVGGYGMVADGSLSAPASHSEYVALKAVSDKGDSQEVTFNGNTQPITIGSVIVTTGEQGTITVTLSKSSGELFGYMDEIRLREAYDAIGIAVTGDYILEQYTVTDENGKLVYGVHKGRKHIISGSVRNRTNHAGVVTIQVTGHDKRDTVRTYESQEKTIESGGLQEFSLEIDAPLVEDAYFKLLLINEALETTEYTLSNTTLSQQYTKNYDLFVQDFSVRNETGSLIAEPVAGSFNAFEITLMNRSTSDISMEGILVIYVDGRMNEVMFLDRDIPANDEDRFWLGTTLPSEGDNITVKLFVWNSLLELKPLTEANLYTVSNK